MEDYFRHKLGEIVTKKIERDEENGIPKKEYMLEVLKSKTNKVTFEITENMLSPYSIYPYKTNLLGEVTVQIDDKTKQQILLEAIKYFNKDTKEEQQ